MNFDRIAPHYRWLETVAFGGHLQQARVAFLGETEMPRRVLVVGEGDGRFLAEFVSIYPGAAVDCIESSGKMIVLARRRGAKAVRFIQEDIRQAALPVAHYDLVVTHFVLDCFGRDDLRIVIAKLARAATEDASWLLADFREPVGGWARRHAKLWLRLMYTFFRITSGLEADRLIDPSQFLAEKGFARKARRLSRFEMITSEWWRRSA